MLSIATSLIAMVLSAGPAATAGEYCQITVVDEQTGRGVPLVELRTVNNIRHVTDSNGVVAFYEPGVMDQPVFFHVKSHGYEFPKDGFGYRGKAVPIESGGSVVWKIKRTNIAERLYRMTGAGIYRDTLLTGDEAPIAQPVINGKVFGSDSVVNAVMDGKIYWFWGDTNRPRYPLGNFHVPGATSQLPSAGGLDPGTGVNLDYFLDENGFAKETARLPGDGPTWITSLVVVRDPVGRERMLAGYVKVRKGLEVYQRGLAEFDPAGRRFEKVVEFDMDAPVHPNGHPLTVVVDETEYVYFANPFPLVRVRADPDALKDLSQYEALTCLKAGTRLDAAELDRMPDGTLKYTWKRNTPPLGQTGAKKLIRAGRLKPEEARFQLTDRHTRQPVVAHRGSVYWNEFRGRYVMIAVEQGGTSFLGEVWYAEADSPEGPWTRATKIATHDKYSFYNPKQHPMFDQQGGRVIYFEGTYTTTFSGNADRTPRYDYNQVMYRLDLSDPRLR